MNDIADISEVTKLVGRLIPGTEEQFLPIGSGLNKVYTDEENVSRQASALVGLLDSSAMKGTIVRFRNVLGQLEGYIDKFHQRFESGYSALKDVGNAVTDVAIPMANFRKIVARKSFEACLAIVPEDSPSKLFLSRITSFQSDPPGDQWEGIWNLSGK